MYERENVVIFHIYKINKVLHILNLYSPSYNKTSMAKLKARTYTKEAAQYSADFIERGLSIKEIAAKYGKKESTIQQYSAIYKWRKAREKYMKNVNVSMSDIALNIRNNERAVVWKRVAQKAQDAIDHLDMYTDDQQKLATALQNGVKLAQILKMAFEGERIEEGQPIILRREVGPETTTAPRLSSFFLIETDKTEDKELPSNEESPKDIMEGENASP